LAARGGRRSVLADYALPTAVTAGLLAVLAIGAVSGVTARLDRVSVTNAASGSDLLRVLIVFAIPAAVSAAFSWRPVRFGVAALAMLLVGLPPLRSPPAVIS